MACFTQIIVLLISYYCLFDRLYMQLSNDFELSLSPADINADIVNNNNPAMKIEPVAKPVKRSSSVNPSKQPTGK